MKMKALSIIALSFIASTSYAAQVNFSAYNGYTGTKTITSDDGNVSVYTPNGSQLWVNPSNKTDFCPILSGSGIACTAKMEISFNNGTAKDVVFSNEAYGNGDKAKITAFDSNNNSIKEFIINNAATIDFTGYSGIKKIIIDDLNSTKNGFRYKNFEYTSEVPVPAAAWLFGSALAGLAGLRRNK